MQLKPAQLRWRGLSSSWRGFPGRRPCCFGTRGGRSQGPWAAATERRYWLQDFWSIAHVSKYLRECGGHRRRNFCLCSALKTRTSTGFGDGWTNLLLWCQENLWVQIIKSPQKLHIVVWRWHTSSFSAVSTAWLSTSSFFCCPLPLWGGAVEAVVGTNSTSTASFFWSFFRLLDLRLMGDLKRFQNITHRPVCH